MLQWFVLCLVLLSLYPVRVTALPLSQFYPFNTTVGDSQTEKSDDGGSGKINLRQAFPFFGKRHDKLYVNNNGVISFVQELRTYRPSDFPLSDQTPLIAPFWADGDVDKVGGVIYYRETTDGDFLAQVEAEFLSYSSAYRTFQANWTFIATWYEVGYYGATGGGKGKRNTFQCVLVSDGTQSFVIFNYHKIEWTTGSNGNGVPETGLGGNPAQAGFNAGDGINFYEIEGALTDSVINLTRTSNVFIPGRWIFRVDSPVITGYESEQDQSTSTSTSSSPLPPSSVTPASMSTPTTPVTTATGSLTTTTSTFSSRETKTDETDGLETRTEAKSDAHIIYIAVFCTVGVVLVVAIFSITACVIVFLRRGSRNNGGQTATQMRKKAPFIWNIRFNEHKQGSDNNVYEEIADETLTDLKGQPPCYDQPGYLQAVTALPAGPTRSSVPGDSKTTTQDH